MDVNNYINDFKNKICEITSIEYLETLNKNLEVLEIKHTKFKTRLDINNKVLYLNTKKNSDIYHVLLNLSSYDMTSVNFKMGFSNVLNNKLVGIGFNKIITEYFYKSLFSIDTDTNIGEIISIFIGEKKLLELYLKADLEGLISELSKYIELSHIMKIINTFDNINIKKTENYNEVIEILINGYTNKIRNNLDTNELDKVVKLLTSITDLNEVDILHKINNYMNFSDNRLNRKTML